MLARALLLSHHYVSVNYCWYCVVHPSQGTRTRVSAASEWIDSGSCFPRPSAGPLETRYALPGSDSHTRVARNVELEEFATFRALLQPGRVAIVVGWLGTVSYSTTTPSASRIVRSAMACKLMSCVEIMAVIPSDFTTDWMSAIIVAPVSASS